jgi:hypothetical protein
MERKDLIEEVGDQIDMPSTPLNARVREEKRLHGVCVLMPLGL